ncbi:MAG: hypothetical protein ACPKM0_07745 [Pleomorphochaeta sp.]
MAKQNGYARNIFFSIIISLLVLISLGFLSIKYLVPIYDLQTQDIYKFLIYLLPILIGLVLIEIGSIISSRNDEKLEDSEDLLPRNSYDNPLFTTINDDPNEKVDMNHFNPIAKTQVEMVQREYTIEDFLDKEVAKRISRYNTKQILNIFDEFEEPKKTVIPSPFNADITKEISKLSNEEIIKAYKWIENGAIDIKDIGIKLDNLNEDTISKIQTLSQREADKIFDILENNKKYFNFENISDENLCALSRLNNEQINNALNWIASGSPTAADPNAVYFDNLDSETIERVKDYNSLQVNVGLNYVDDGAPDIITSDYIKFDNLNNTTIERVKNSSDLLINRGLDILENEFVNNLDLQTVDRLNSYNNTQVNLGLDYIDSGEKEIHEDLPFGHEINHAIRSLTLEEATRAINFINNPDDFIPNVEQIEDLPFGHEINHAIRSLTLEEATRAINYINEPIDIENNLGDLSNNLEDFLNSELKDNEEYNFDISLVIFDKENEITDENKNMLLSYLPAYTYIYDTIDNRKAIIFPYENKDSAKLHIQTILDNHANLLENKDIVNGYSSKDGRKIDAKTLIDEANA